MPLSESIPDVDALEELLSEPTPELVAMLERLEGDILLLGAGGKMGPTLARMAQRAADAAGSARRVIAVSRFSKPGLAARLERHGVSTIACDLLDRRAVEALPDAPNVIWMTGRKFGTSGDRALTWAMNVVAPAIAAERFSRSRLVAFSTGNVYGLTSVDSGGSKETDEPRPIGEYAASALGRERVFEHAAQRFGTRVAILRLNYAVEPRYGVLVDIAQRVLAGEPLAVSMPHVNVIWQGDANAMALRALEHVESPARVLNVAGPELLAVEDIARRFGDVLGVEPRIVRPEKDTSELSLLNDGALGRSLLGAPRVPVDQAIRWIADWLQRGGETHGLPTHFESREGDF